ncbi:hypothetical protein NE865_01980 [Phthorimaea operculella]|nr:hypothetical protein NE865_01980 [Phthorimaea operculella]
MSVSVGKLSEFRLSEGASWVTYTERLEQYLKVNKVAADMKVAVLIASVGDPTYDLMVDLCSPKKPVDVPYDDLVKLLQQHLEPTPSILAERYAFRHRKQNANESIAQYAAALKHLARTCDFKTNLTENLRDQFVCGISDEPTRQRLFYEGDPDFQKAFKIASSLESAAQNAAAVEQPRKEEGSIHAMQASARASGARRTGGGAAGGSGEAARRGAGAGPRRWDSAAGVPAAAPRAIPVCLHRQEGGLVFHAEARNIQGNVQVPEIHLSYLSTRGTYSTCVSKSTVR